MLSEVVLSRLDTERSSFGEQPGLSRYIGRAAEQGLLSSAKRDYWTFGSGIRVDRYKRPPGVGYRQGYLIDYRFLLPYNKMVSDIWQLLDHEFKCRLRKTIFTWAFGYLDSKPSAQWGQFLDRCESHYQERPCVWKLDIVTFFDQIPVELLIDRLEGLGIPKALCEDLYECLRYMPSYNYYTGRGIPQGYFASHILAGIFLYDLLRDPSGRLVYSAYVDDIRVFGSTLDEAISSVDRIKNVLRLVGLEVNPEKSRRLYDAELPGAFDGVEWGNARSLVLYYWRSRRRPSNRANITEYFNPDSDAIAGDESEGYQFETDWDEVYRKLRVDIAKSDARALDTTFRMLGVLGSKVAIPNSKQDAFNVAYCIESISFYLAQLGRCDLQRGIGDFYWSGKLQSRDLESSVGDHIIFEKGLITENALAAALRRLDHDHYRTRLVARKIIKEHGTQHEWEEVRAFGTTITVADTVHISQFFRNSSRRLRCLFVDKLDRRDPILSVLADDLMSISGTAA